MQFNIQNPVIRTIVLGLLIIITLFLFPVIYWIRPPDLWGIVIAVVILVVYLGVFGFIYYYWFNRPNEGDASNAGDDAASLLSYFKFLCALCISYATLHLIEYIAQSGLGWFNNVDINLPQRVLLSLVFFVVSILIGLVIGFSSVQRKAILFVLGLFGAFFSIYGPSIVKVMYSSGGYESPEVNFIIASSLIIAISAILFVIVYHNFKIKGSREWYKLIALSFAMPGFVISLFKGENVLEQDKKTEQVFAPYEIVEVAHQTKDKVPIYSSIPFIRNAYAEELSADGSSEKELSDLEQMLQSRPNQIFLAINKLSASPEIPNFFIGITPAISEQEADDFKTRCLEDTHQLKYAGVLDLQRRNLDISYLAVYPEINKGNMFYEDEAYNKMKILEEEIQENSPCVGMEFSVYEKVFRDN